VRARFHLTLPQHLAQEATILEAVSWLIEQGVQVDRIEEDEGR
jgi:hypothetical protein